MHSQPAQTVAPTRTARSRGASSVIQSERGKGQAEYPRPRERPVLHNRIPAVMVHVSRYAFEGQARLAADVGVSRSTISRFLRGHTLPSYALVEAVARALSARSRQPLTPRELVSFDGTYPTASTCALVGCRGCLPEQAYDGHGSLLPEWRGARPGDWSRFPQMPSPEMDSPERSSPSPQRPPCVTEQRTPGQQRPILAGATP